MRSVVETRFLIANLIYMSDTDFLEHDPSQDSATRKWFKDQGGWWHYVSSEGAVYR